MSASHFNLIRLSIADNTFILRVNGADFAI